MIHEIQPTAGQYPSERVSKPGPVTGVTEPAQPAAGQGDRVEISDLAYWRAKIDALPAARAEEIAAIRQQIAEGTYETPEKLDAAVDRLLADVAANNT